MKEQFIQICVLVVLIGGVIRGSAVASKIQPDKALVEQESREIEQMKTDKDIDGLIDMLANGTFPSKVTVATYLKDMAARLGKKTGQERMHFLSTEIERVGMEEFRKRGKSNIQPNVDFFSAPVYHMMGIPLDLMTPIFAMSRVSGWASHIIEEKFGEAQEKPALYRPQAEYVGNYCGLMGCTLEEVEE